jgi:hypothetical protein
MVLITGASHSPYRGLSFAHSSPLPPCPHQVCNRGILIFCQLIDSCIASFNPLFHTWCVKMGNLCIKKAGSYEINSHLPATQPMVMVHPLYG